MGDSSKVIEDKPARYTIKKKAAPVGSGPHSRGFLAPPLPHEGGRWSPETTTSNQEATSLIRNQ